MITVTDAQLAAWLGAVFWPLTRVLALFAAAPLLSHRAIPTRMKVALALAITAVLAPTLSVPPLPAVLTGEGLALLAYNVLVGLTIGFAVRIVLAAFDLAGELIGLQMGLSFAGFFNPASGSSQNPVGGFLALLALLTFVAIDGHLMLLHALLASFEAFPLTGRLAPLDLPALLRLGADLFALALSIALPFVAVLLLINVVLGVLARIAPQLNVFAVGFPLTLLAGMTLLLVLLPYLQAPLLATLERALLPWR
ncbi:MAG: flagellar biosynthetic protein FliR [Sutterellaceae bacterium]|nr:flagellar biosynthetic protein FliR [Burkholderiaceae bacterium]MDW8431005.1 flagellar biosynthetic protein FliR [Sutterellaceae bacterium]